MRRPSVVQCSRVLVLGACLAAAAGRLSVRAQQPDTACGVVGTIVSGRSPLPGVVVSAVDADGRTAAVSTSSADGTYAVEILQPGRYTLKTEFAAFAPTARDITIEAANCRARVDLSLTLASRAAPASAPPSSRQGAAASSASASNAANGSGSGVGPAANGRGEGRRGQRGASPASQPFQSLALRADDEALARSDDAGTIADGAASLLPPGFSPETSTESVAAIGSANANESFFGPNGAGDFADRFANFGGGPGGPAATDGRQAGPGGFGGRGGFGGGGPFGGPGPFGRGGRGNQIRGSVFQSVDTSALDAAPYALNGPTTKPDYLQQRFGATVGGPLVIPKIVNSPSTFFFLNYTGNHSRNPYDAYSTVPTAAERAGDFSAFGRTIVDPTTGLPFAGNQIPTSRIDPGSKQLLSLIPEPNQPGTVKNFHNVTTVQNDLDDVNLRFVRTFGATPQRGQRGGGAGGGRGGPGGRGGVPRQGVSNLNVTVHFRHADTTSANPLPALGGETSTTSWDVPASYSFTKANTLQSLRFDFNRQHSEGLNLFAYSQDIGALAGLQGVSTDPFDWGAPNLSFAGFQSLREVTPSVRTDQTLSFGDTLTRIKNRHTMRFGGDFRTIHADSRTDSNARGSFVFTGFYSGVDFADFLLGKPQQASVQFNPTNNQFRSTSWDLFAQDDWRVTDKVTVNAGLRYEFFSPVSEIDNQLVTLDVSPTFTSAVPVTAGSTGPFSGPLPDTIVRPFHKGFAPRVGVAWRASQTTVLRGGYGINYSPSVYQTIAQQLAMQSGSATVNTLIVDRSSNLTLQNILPHTAAGSTLPTYGVDPNYALPFVQVWNVDLQHDLTRTVQMGIGYAGTKGSNLDLLEAPNRTATGLLVPTLPPYIFESSVAASHVNALTLRIRKRLTSGVAFGATYVLSKAIDDASSIGGAGGTVAQDPTNLQAETGLSPFDQRHQFNASATYELPFGAGKRWFQTGATAAWLGNWTINATLQLASGTPYTAVVLGAVTDVARGSNGTLRANYNGEPIQIADPTVGQFFNTGAFSPPLPGTFGDAGRNTIIGPGTSTLNAGLTKNVNFGQTTRGLSIQILASNLLNDVQFAAIDTNLNSPTFGQVTAVRPMRRVQLLTRIRF